MEDRICTRCKQLLPITKYNKVKNGNKGYSCRCSKCIYESYQKNRSDKKKYATKLYQIKYYYNLDKTQYEALVEEAQNSCMICKKKEKDLTTGLCIDHCHTDNGVRGLLCQDCNRGLGMFKDNLDFLQNAIDYLKSGKRYGG